MANLESPQDSSGSASHPFFQLSSIWLVSPLILILWGVWYVAMVYSVSLVWCRLCERHRWRKQESLMSLWKAVEVLIAIASAVASVELISKVMNFDMTPFQNIAKAMNSLKNSAYLNGWTSTLTCETFRRRSSPVSMWTQSSPLHPTPQNLLSFRSLTYLYLSNPLQQPHSQWHIWPPLEPVSVPTSSSSLHTHLIRYKSRLGYRYPPW